MNKNKIYQDSKDEWYTPIKVIDYARRVMGHIDYDPCTNDDLAIKHKIPVYTDKYGNGLTQNWKGNVWLNPPFSNKDMWVKKLINEIKKGNVKKAMLLLPMAMETKLWHEWILPEKPTLHIPNERIAFMGGTTAPFPSILVEFNGKGKWMVADFSNSKQLKLDIKNGQ